MEGSRRLHVSNVHIPFHQFAKAPGDFHAGYIKIPGKPQRVGIAEKIYTAVKDVNAQDKVVCVVPNEAANAQLAANLLNEKYN